MMKPKILLVDDSPLFLELEKNILGRGDYLLYEACNGKEALDIVRSELPDLILLDVNMPVMNGFEFLIFLRNSERFQNIPVILVTTKGRDKDVKYALELGADDFITKPIDNRILIMKVKSILKTTKRRNSPRLLLKIDAELNDFKRKYNGIIRDLSPGGAHLYTDTLLTEKSKIELKFAIPFEGGLRPVKVFGKVISATKHQVDDGESHYEVRIQFINLSREIIFFIENLITKDTRTIASFLFSSPSQRKDYHDESEKIRQESQATLLSELNGFLDEFYHIESVKKKFLEKYDKLKNHLKESQLDFCDLSLKNSRLEQDYLALSNLFVASYQLTTRENVAGVLNVLSDIIENLCGVDKFDFVLFQQRTNTCTSLLTGEKFDHSAVESSIFTKIMEGEIFCGEIQKHAENRPDIAPLIYIPIMIKGFVMGFIVIYSFFPHVKSISAVLVQLFSLLSQQLGMALFAATFLDEGICSRADLDRFILEKLLRAE
ncbi:response regulator [candidate division CSSED10-310 bacterium]|uniref:Response regulator n=1 Tax=candidate division CSSED10-310 bacterium TaxID=2855610 RepID=A0ABV6YVE8_UNCC1